MFKKGKKIVLLLLALALALGVFAACGSTYKAKPLDGYESSQNAAQSNGGSVVKKHLPRVFALLGMPLIQRAGAAASYFLE